MKRMFAFRENGWKNLRAFLVSRSSCCWPIEVSPRRSATAGRSSAYWENTNLRRRFGTLEHWMFFLFLLLFSDWYWQKSSDLSVLAEMLLHLSWFGMFFFFALSFALFSGAEPFCSLAGHEDGRSGSTAGGWESRVAIGHLVLNMKGFRSFLFQGRKGNNAFRYLLYMNFIEGINWKLAKKSSKLVRFYLASRTLFATICWW